MIVIYNHMNLTKRPKPTSTPIKGIERKKKINRSKEQIKQFKKQLVDKKLQKLSETKSLYNYYKIDKKTRAKVKHLLDMFNVAPQNANIRFKTEGIGKIKHSFAMRFSYKGKEFVFKASGSIRNLVIAMAKAEEIGFVLLKFENFKPYLFAKKYPGCTIGLPVNQKIDLLDKTFDYKMNFDGVIFPVQLEILKKNISPQIIWKSGLRVI